MNEEKLYKFEVIWLYRVWQGMKDRCNGKHLKSKKYYYDKKITYCSRWEIFDNFYDDMISTYQKGLVLDRIDNNKGYEFDNCRWITFTESNRNKTSNIFIEYNGKQQLLIDVCNLLNLNYHTVIERYHKGIRDNNLLLSKESLRTINPKPIIPCIICGTLGGDKANKKDTRPARRKGMCAKCYRRNYRNKR